MIRFTQAELDAHKARLARLKATGMVRTHILSNQSVAAVKNARNGLKPALPATTGGKAVPHARSALEIALQAQIEAAGLPEAEYDVVYLVGRAYRLDVCWADKKLGVEVQGMVPRIKRRFRADIEKPALGLIQGWRVLEVDREAITSGKALAWIKQLLK